MLPELSVSHRWKRSSICSMGVSVMPSPRMCVRNSPFVIVPSPVGSHSLSCSLITSGTSILNMSLARVSSMVSASASASMRSASPSHSSIWASSSLEVASSKTVGVRFGDGGALCGGVYTFVFGGEFGFG